MHSAVEGKYDERNDHFEIIFIEIIHCSLENFTYFLSNERS